MYKIGVVIPCYKVSQHILSVLENIGSEVSRIYVVDDDCPELTGEIVYKTCRDTRVSIIFHTSNQGVGAAVITGYLAGLSDDIDIFVKIDGDMQMDPKLIFQFIEPLINGEADYAKGNRFFELDNLQNMPRLRVLGNSCLSILTKFSSGYWDIFDPTNGYTAIHASVFKLISFNKLSPRYFFESDMLFRLNIVKAVVIDVPMVAKYGDEISNLKISKIAFEFLFLHVKNFAKRIFYNYYLRDLSIASLELPIGVALILFGLFYGAINWLHSGINNVATPPGTLIVVALSLLSGLQLMLAFINYDVGSVPKRVRHKSKR